MSALTKGKDFLSIDDCSSEQFLGLLSLAEQLKTGKRTASLRGKVLGLLFLKASTRTRVSFTVAMYQLGGQVIDLSPSNTQVGRGEPVKDTARILSRYVNALAIRTFAQSEIEEYAQYANIPVINALTDLEHPCQILADLLTVQEAFGDLAGRKLAYVGDGNNVAHSLLLGCAKAGVSVAIAAPKGFEPDPAIVERSKQIAAETGSAVIITTDPQEAVADADALYTDVWASMGQEEESISRQSLFRDFQINDTLLKQAKPNAIVLHCLPAHREEEITDAVIEGPQSWVWRQAENRLHVQKAVLASLA